MRNENDEIDELTKIIIIGEQAVGKSSLISRYCNGEFDFNMIGTAGVDFRKKILKIESNIVNLIIFDTAGQQRYRSITKYFYQGCKGVILVFDTSELITFTNLKDWLQTIQQNTDIGIQILLVANKIDLPRQVSTEQGKSFAEEVNLSIIETSAKTGFNVEKAFETLIRKIIIYENEDKNKKERENENNRKNIDIEKNKKKDSVSCCGKG